MLNSHSARKLSATFIYLNFLTDVLKTPCETSSLLHALRAVYYKNVEAEISPKFMKTYELKLEHPQAQSNFTRSYTNECIKSRDAVDQVADDVDPV